MAQRLMKSDPNHDNWLGYIVAVFVNETITQSIECCPGCTDRKNSPLLHTHHHAGLLEKLYSQYLTPSIDRVTRTTPIIHVQPTSLKRVANKLKTTDKNLTKKQKSVSSGI